MSQLIPWLTLGAAVLAFGAVAADGGKVPATLTITSPAFESGGRIPRINSCDGKDRSPALAWSGVPASAKTLALICDDPDAPVGTWVHWVLYDLPAGQAGLVEGIPTSPMLEGGARQGLNGWSRTGYGGPCPPPGKPHRYFFRLYALDAALSLSPGATKQEVLDAMKGHVVGQGELMGTYVR